MTNSSNKFCHKMLIFSVLFFITSLFISAVGAEESYEPITVEKEKTLEHIQVQQEEIHKKLVHIESQLTAR